MKQEFTKKSEALEIAQQEANRLNQLHYVIDVHGYGHKVVGQDFVLDRNYYHGVAGLKMFFTYCSTATPSPREEGKEAPEAITDKELGGKLEGDLLKTYAFTDEDINLITFAVRRLSETTGMANLKADSVNLLQYIERLKIELLTSIIK